MFRYRSLLLVGCLALVMTTRAADHERITGSFSFTDTLDCVDPFLVEGAYDEVMHTYYDRFGVPVRLEFTGFVSIIFTNVVTGQSYRPNTSGPGTVDLGTGHSIVRGGNGVLFDSEGKLISTDGRVVLDENGEIILLTAHVVDVCARIGSSAR